MQVLPNLRERSRQAYLTKREQQQILLLKQRIKDEEELFHDERLTKAEEMRLQYYKNLLRLAEERMSISDKFEGYNMPEGKGFFSGWFT